MPSSGAIRIVMHIRLHLVLRGQLEEQVRHPVELDDDLGHFVRHSFAGSQIERDIGPSPVIDEEFERDVGFGV